MSSTTREEQLKDACVNGEEAKMRAVLQEDPSLINSELDDYKNTPLLVACWNNHLPLVKTLLTYEGILINKQNKWGRTPLYFACFDGYDKIVEELLKRAEIEVNLSSNNGDSPLHAACYCGHSAVVRLLLSDGRVDRNKKNQDGKTAFDGICSFGDKSQAPVIQKLFESSSSLFPKSLNPIPNESQPPPSDKSDRQPFPPSHDLLKR